MSKPLRVLMVEDSEDDALLTIRALTKGGFDPVYERVETAGAMQKSLQEKTWDVVLCDYQMPKFNGLAAIALLKETDIDIPLIIVSGVIGEEMAADCMRDGADDYVMKNNLSRLVPAIERELMEVDLRTGRRQAEEALQRSEKRYRLLVENTNEAIVVVQDGCARFVNRGVEWTGYTREEYLSIPIMETIHPEDREAAEQRYLKKINGDTTPTRHRYRVLNKDGQIHWIDVSSTLIEWEGRPATLNLINDITDRKRAEDDVMQARKEWEHIFQAISHPTVILDPQHGIIAANKSVLCASGLSRGEILGKKCYEIFHGKNAVSPPAGCPMESLLASGRAETVNREMEAFGGIYLVSCTPIRNQEGIVEKIIHITIDITHLKRTEEDLRRSEERYRSIFENAQDGIYRSTPAGRIITANPAMARMLGYASPEELMTGIIDAARQLYVDPEERARIRQIIEENGPVINREVQVYRKDGSIFWISLTIQAIRDGKGGILHYEGMADDITDRKQSFERLRKTLGATIQAIASTVETRDPYTAGHQRRVADLARVIAMEMNLSTDQVDGIRMAAAIHDLGKISVPAEILSKPTKISALEFGLIKTHSQSGYDILKDIDFPWPIARIVLEHHERMDGSGYPNGLAEEEILLESRILAVADVVESIASHRPYRPALGIDAAMEEIEKNRGTLYDADAVDACLSLFQEKRYQLSS